MKLTRCEELGISERQDESEKQSLAIENHNQLRKSLYFQDEFFDNSPLPIEKVKDDKKVQFAFARMFNLYMHELGKDPAFVMCRKCKEWVETNYKCCGV